MLLSIDGAVVLAVDGNSFSAVLNKIKTYFCDVLFYVLFIWSLSLDDLTQDAVHSKMSIRLKKVSRELIKNYSIKKMK